ncbi:hypothetical protein CAPTEDRAFT_94956 [Capitella teleta]|uniref:Uncharacterized protein n=1 Tax=Capitella teleta TaxID=283909 RepID=R7TW07_CAPTE|nr:hypothetical protein CAPTEDRAFT_94956 [Capitella teleta]|eukprot:ELT97889.1 hypothetical protein CAPTEDRAFT_94956 [Capitella teleta]
MKGKEDDDFIDRLSCRYTMMLLLLFAVVSFYQFGGSLIIYWFTVHFTACWIKNTYYISYEDEIPGPEEQKHFVVLCQWISFIQLVQILILFVPDSRFLGFVLLFPIHKTRSTMQKTGVDADDIKPAPIS